MATRQSPTGPKSKIPELKFQLKFLDSELQRNDSTVESQKEALKRAREREPEIGQAIGRAMRERD